MVVLFCDSGGGHDENVIVRREGNKIEIVCGWREANKEAAAGRFIREFVSAKSETRSGDRGRCGQGAVGFGGARRLAGAKAEFRAVPSTERRLHVMERQWLGWKAAAEVSRCEWILPHDDILFRGNDDTAEKTQCAREMAGGREIRDAQAQRAQSRTGQMRYLGAWRCRITQQMTEVVEGPWIGWQQAASDQRDRSIWKKSGQAQDG